MVDLKAGKADQPWRIFLKSIDSSELGNQTADPQQ
jgi:hypothetical protein